MGFILAVSLFVMPLTVAANNETSDQLNNVDVRYLYVQPGQTLHNIVTLIYSHRKSEWSKISNDIVRINPHAFINGNATKMKAGVRLELPQRNKPKHSTQDHSSVGNVLLARGRALAVDNAKQSRQLATGDSVFVGDKLITGADGFIRLHMIDDAILDLRCYSIMVIEDYALKSATSNNRSVLNLLEGSLKKITGQIGKWKEDVYQLKTPIASIGVRGTEYALRVYQSKGCDGTIDLNDNGLYLEVSKGLIDVSNQSGVTVVEKGQTLYIPLPGAVPVDKTIDAGVINPENSHRYWWYLLGLVFLVAAL